MNQWMQPVGLLVLRMAFGLMLMSHGYGKVFVTHAEGLIKFSAEHGFPLPFVFGWAGALSEFFGALFMTVGLLTRPAALFVACTMGVAAFVAHAADPFGTKEKALMYLAASVAILLLGPGPLSLDRLWGRGKGR